MHREKKNGVKDNKNKVTIDPSYKIKQLKRKKLQCRTIQDHRQPKIDKVKLKQPH